MTDWEARYRAGDTPWDKGEAAPPLHELFARKGVSVFGEGVVLVPGCGAGHDVRALAAAGHRAVGLDIAPSAIRLAESLAAVAEESYLLADFLEAAESLRALRPSAIWEHTCFCAIDPSRRRDYAAAAAALLESGGLLAAVFFLTPFDPGESAQGPPHGASIDEIDDCFQPWFDREDAWIPEHAYPGREGREWLVLFRRK